MIQKIKGTMDLFPEDTLLFRYIEGVMRREAERFGFGEIRTPTFESTDLFVRGVGDTTDVVQKEMYTFVDGEDGKSISLRPEGTASVVRALIENGRCGGVLPIKLYYIISCFRHEKPQAGRSREFFQFGTEMFGSDSPLADATVMALGHSVLSRLGLTDVKLHINSIGCPTCRGAYRRALVAYYTENQEKICQTCKERLKKNPLRLLDCKNPDCAVLAKAAPRTVDHLCEECAEKFSLVKQALGRLQVPYTVDTGIVRGLDYYTNTVFEFIAEGIGAQSTVCGGGRYNGLVSSLGGPELPGIGFGMGLTRVILAMKEKGLDKALLAPHPRLYIAALGKNAALHALEITARLRAQGQTVECDIVGRSLKAQMKYADKLGAEYTLILGDSEVESGRAMLRNMKESTQVEVELSTFTL